MEIANIVSKENSLYTHHKINAIIAFLSLRRKIMKIKFKQPKGQRVFKGTVKVQGKRKRVPIFMGLENLDNNHLMWSDTLNRWVSISDCSEGDYPLCSISKPIRSVKAAIRHVRKHDEISKGARMVLVSAFVGYDVEIIK